MIICTPNDFAFLFLLEEDSISLLINANVLADTEPDTLPPFDSMTDFNSSLLLYFSNDPVITKDSFPEMWNRNIHMTTISYSDPQYDVSIADPEISNVGNDSKSLYANIDSTAEFIITPKFIYNFE